MFIFAPDLIKHDFIISRYWSSSVYFIAIKDVVTLNLMNKQDLTYFFYVNSKLNELLSKNKRVKKDRNVYQKDITVNLYD